MGTIRNTTLVIEEVEIPVALRQATEKSDVSFGRASADGNKIARKEIDSETGEVIDPETVRRGIWQGEEFREIAQSEIDLITQEGTLDSIEIEEFVPLKNLDLGRSTGRFYLTLQKEGIGAKALKTFHEAMRKRKVGGCGLVCPKSRQYPFILRATSDGFILNVVAFPAQQRDIAADSKRLLETKVEREFVERASELIAVKTSEQPEFLATVEDVVVKRRTALIDEALSGKPLKKKPLKREETKPPEDIVLRLTKSIERASKKREKASVG